MDAMQSTLSSESSTGPRVNDTAAGSSTGTTELLDNGVQKNKAVYYRCQVSPNRLHAEREMHVTCSLPGYGAFQTPTIKLKRQLPKGQAVLLKSDALDVGDCGEYQWMITITKRANKRRQLQPHTVPTQQLPSTPSEPALRQSRPKTRLPRLPPPTAEDYKLAIRPNGGLNLSKVSLKTLLLALAHAANICSETPDIKLRVDENQNVLTISTPSDHIATALGQITKITVHAATYEITSYGIAPDNSCKVVINEIGHEITPDDFLTEVEVPGYEVLTCRRLGDSGAMVLTFCGKRVPFFINAYGQALHCYLYKRTIPTVESTTKQDTTTMCAHSLLTHRNVECVGIHYHLTTTSAALLACFVVATTRRLPNHAQSGFCSESTDANHPGQLLPPGRPSHHPPASDGRAVRPGAQPGEGAVPVLSRGPSEETRHRGAVSLVSRDLKAGTRTGQRIISKAVPTRKHKRCWLSRAQSWRRSTVPVVNSSSGSSALSEAQRALVLAFMDEHPQLVANAIELRHGVTITDRWQELSDALNHEVPAQEWQAWWRRPVHEARRDTAAIRDAQT
ncbi:hypothetical protein HPB51_021600 [Rhipicephalus microplus]|uniref:Uncharacterized protein n=1 Tax=Rhipicephalus microplus TaxID=6941 RepID=A0A9J6EJ68_RHIMP|nr:hypothetical protein HPB51_021600 [Rhipicephalus microplus]